MGLGLGLGLGLGSGLELGLELVLGLAVGLVLGLVLGLAWRERRARRPRALDRRSGAGGAAVRALECGADRGAGQDRVADTTERLSEDRVHGHDRRGAAVRRGRVGVHAWLGLGLG